MLVLARKLNEKIDIGDGLITLHVAGFRFIHGAIAVELGIDAPREMSVHRQEVADEIRRYAEAQKSTVIGE